MNIHIFVLVISILEDKFWLEIWHKLEPNTLKMDDLLESYTPEKSLSSLKSKTRQTRARDD